MAFCPNCGTEYGATPLRCQCGYLFGSAPVAPVSMATPGRFEFTGDGAALLMLYLKLIFFSIFTLGIYSFWGRTEIRRYLWSNTKLAGQPFGYHGTGKEIFLGWLVLMGILAVAWGSVALGVMAGGERAVSVLGLLPVLVLAGLAPLALHGALRYRMSRTSWQGRRFRYEGNFGELAKIVVLGILLSLVTLSLYSPILLVKIRRYVTQNTSYGGRTFEYVGEDSALLWPYIKMLLLILPTLGLWRFWFEAEAGRALWGATRYAGVPMRANWKGSELLWLGFTNGIIAILTLGIGYPWTVCRRVRYLTENLQLMELPRVELLPQATGAEDGFGEAASSVMGIDAALDWGFGL